MAKYIPGRNYIGSSEIATDLDVTGPATFANNITLNSSDTDTYIEKVDAGDIYILNSSDDKDIIFGSDDGSGNATTYFALDGSAVKTLFYKNTEHQDNVKAEFGNSADLQIFHDGTHGQITNNSSNLFIKNNTNDGDIVFQSDDGSGGTTAYITLDGGLGFTQAQKKIRFKDSVAAEFGDQGDFLIKHTGSHADLTNGTGDIRITNNTDDGDILFKTDNGSGGVTSYIQLDGSDLSTKILTQKLIISNLPTSNPGVDGQVWNNSGVLNISSG